MLQASGRQLIAPFSIGMPNLAEGGIVHKRSTSINTPQVISSLNANGVPLIEPIRRDTSRETCKIVNDVPRESIMITINPARIWSEA